MKKLGRNDPCPCGSGKKFKKCHGGLEVVDRAARVMAAGSVLRARMEAKEYQRAEQQGLGRPIIAARMDNGHQFVAVNNRLFHSKNWKTFHDFLGHYLLHVMGPEWGTSEIQKPIEERHPILIWYHKLCDLQRAMGVESGKISKGPMTGAVAAYMNLAYDLYALDHNADLQAKLISRLRDKDNFSGARYEVQVAATLSRAGFLLAFENEDDRDTTHCEFTATHIHSGRRFSVEAKRSGSNRTKVTRQIVRALQKSADHTRIVFVDLNTPDSSTGDEMPAYIQRAFNLMRRFEALDPHAQRLPPAYIFLTNSPWEHHLDSTDFRRLTLGDGFHIDEFKIDHEFQSLRAAIDGRQAHVEMHELLKSIDAHSDIPVTFDGQNPELAFDTSSARLTIGERYTTPGPDGVEVEGVLTSATVMEKEKIALCGLNTPDGRGMLFTVPLTDAELAAWRRHPETFFGEVSRNRKAETVLDLYDFFMETYSKTPKAKLLEFLKDSHDMDYLATLDQAALASIYCERHAAQAFSTMGPGPKSLLQSRLRPRNARASSA